MKVAIANMKQGMDLTGAAAKLLELVNRYQQQHINEATVPSSFGICECDICVDARLLKAEISEARET